MALPDGIVPISIYVPVEVKDFFKDMAENEDRSLSNFIGRFLENEYRRRKDTRSSGEHEKADTNLALAA